MPRNTPRLDAPVMVDITTLEYADYNPRNCTPKEEEDIRQSLIQFGFAGVVVANKAKGRKNIIVGGHQRVRIARELGVKQVPVIWVDLPLEEEKKLNLRLNKNQGHFDFEKLGEEFTSDILLDVGFDDVSFMPDFTPPGAGVSETPTHTAPLNKEPGGEGDEEGEDFVPSTSTGSDKAEEVNVTIVVGHIRLKVPKSAFTKWLTGMHSRVGYDMKELRRDVARTLGIDYGL